MESCRACGRKLRPFTATGDWSTRLYHRGCWEIKQSELQYKLFMEEYKKEAAPKYKDITQYIVCQE